MAYTTDQLKQLQTLADTKGGFGSEEFKNYVDTSKGAGSYDKIRGQLETQQNNLNNTTPQATNTIKPTQTTTQAPISQDNVGKIDTLTGQEVLAPQVEQDNVGKIDTATGQEVLAPNVETPKTEVIPPVPPIPQTTEGVSGFQEGQVVIPKVNTQDQTPEQIAKAKADALNLEEQQKAIKAQESTNYTTGFSNLLTQGASEADLTSYLKKNPTLYTENKAELSTLYKNSITAKKNADFVNTYGNYSNEQLLGAITAGTIVKGSSQYNLLSPEQRASFEQYEKEQQAITDKANIPTGDVNSFTSILTEVKKIFSTDIKKEYTDLLNSPEFKTLSSKSTELVAQIKSIDDQLEYAREDAIAQNPQLAQNSFALNAAISDYKRGKIRERNALVNEYTAVNSEIANKKADINTNLELSKYEDGVNREAYSEALKIYTSQQEQMTAIAKAEFEAKSQEIAAEKERDFKRELDDKDKEFKLQETLINDQLKQEAEARGEAYKAKNKTGEYKTDTKGNLLYIIDGKATNVMSDMGKVITGESTKDYEEKVFENTNGGYDVVRTYNDGRKPSINSYSANGESATGGSLSVQDAIDKARITGQCGQGVNDYLQNIGESRLFGDSWESKKKYATDSEAQVGGIAIWNAGTTENGHVGIVTGINPENGNLIITDWNYNNDEKQSTHEVSAKAINMTGGFYNPKPKIEGDITQFDIARFNSPTFKVDTLKTTKDKELYKSYQAKKNSIMDNEDPSIEDILSISEGGKDLTDTPIQQLQKFGTVLSGIGDLQTTIANANKNSFFGGTGPISGKIASLNPYDTDAQVLKSQLTALIPNLARGVYGEVGVLTDKDVDLYIKTLPNLTATEDVNNAILGLTLRTIQRSYQNTLKTQAAAGRDVSGFIGAYKQIDNQVKAIESSLTKKATPSNNITAQDLLNQYNKKDYSKDLGY